MFQILMLIGWGVLLVILLYVWADVREIAGAVKETRREMMRSSLAGRTGRREASMQDEEEDQEPAEKIQADTTVLKPSEEQILQEVLAEFLG